MYYTIVDETSMFYPGTIYNRIPSGRAVNSMNLVNLERTMFGLQNSIPIVRAPRENEYGNYVALTYVKFLRKMSMVDVFDYAYAEDHLTNIQTAQCARFVFKERGGLKALMKETGQPQDRALHPNHNDAPPALAREITRMIRNA